MDATLLCVWILELKLKIGLGSRSNSDVMTLEIMAIWKAESGLTFCSGSGLYR